MTENSSFLHTRHGATHEMQIGAADSTGGQTHNGVEFVLYGRLLAIVQSNVSNSMENDGFHSSAPGNSFPEIGPSSKLYRGCDICHEERLFLATFAACFANALRTDFGKCAIVRSRLAVCAAFLIFIRAAFLCFSLAIVCLSFRKLV
jgi:hypothetical protein